MARKYSIAWYKEQLKDAHAATAHERQRRKDAVEARDTALQMITAEEEAYCALEQSAAREITDLRQQAKDLSNEVIRLEYIEAERDFCEKGWDDMTDDICKERTAHDKTKALLKETKCAAFDTMTLLTVGMQAVVKEARND